MKKTVQFFVLIVFLALVSCEKDLYEDVIIQSKAKSVTIPVNQVLSEIENPIIKDHINNTLKPQLGFSNNRATSNVYFEFIKIIKEEAYVTYSFLINSYSDDKPYFEYFIITKEGAVEKAGYAKFIPNSPVMVFDEKDFDGKLLVSNLQGDIKGETDFINSQAQPIQSTQSTCVNVYTVVTHNCTNGGNHAPGEACDGGLINNGYYEIIVTISCTNVTDNYLAAPDMFMGATGGGGSLTFNTDVMIFLNGLNDDQITVLQNNPELINYLEDHQVSQESKDFVLKLIQLSLIHGGTFEFDNTINADNAMNFSTFNEFNYFLVNQTDEGTDFEYFDQQNQKIASTKFWIGAPYNGVKVNIKQNMTPTYTVEDVTSEMFGVTVFADWHQSDYSVSTTNNVVTVDVYGVSSVKVFFESVGTIYHENQHFQIRINKLDGTIISSTVIR